MSDNASKRTGADVLRDLNSFLAASMPDVEKMSNDEISSILRKKGIDSKSSFLAIHERLDQELASVALSKAKAKRLERLKGVKPVGQIEKGIREKISLLIGSLSPQMAAGYWSKCESLPDEDLQSLYDDLVRLSKQAGGPDGHEQA